MGSERESWREMSCGCVAWSCACRSRGSRRLSMNKGNEHVCKTCGCGITPGNAHMHGDQRAGHGAVIDVLQDLLAANDQVAVHNRGLFDVHGVLTINLMSSPGAGKTALLEATIAALRDRYRIAVIEGDLETDNDAARIRAHGVPAIQITTGTACHLDAHLVHRALHDLPLAGLDLLFIENVGNLVCPASFDLGQHLNVTLLSVTEGDDKPAKYPVIFRASDLVVLSKADLLDVLDDFDPARAAAALRALGRDTPMIRTAARRAATIGPWLDWLEQELAAWRPVVRPGRSGSAPRSEPDRCLAVPVRVAALLDNQWVEIEVGGIHSRISIALIDAVAVGDYVIVHAGFAITRLDVEEAEKTLALFDEIAAHLRKPDALHPPLP